MDKLLFSDKLLVAKKRGEDLIDNWHNAQLMHLGREKLQKDSQSRFLFTPGYYAFLNRYCKACAVCRATKDFNRSTAENSLYTAIPESPMRSISMDVFAMRDVIVEGEVFDCVILAVDFHSGYIVAVAGKKSEEERQKGKARSGAASQNPGASNDPTLVDRI